MTDNTLASVTIATPPDTSSINAAAALEVVRSKPVTTPAEYEFMALLLRDIKAQWNTVEEERKRIKKPLDAAVAAVQAFFKRPLEWLESAETIAKQKLIDYDREQERIRVEAQRVADEAAAKEREQAQAYGDEHAGMIVAPIIEKAVPRVAGLSMRPKWTYRVTNESLVPREYLKLDDAKIAGVVRAMKRDTHIPGIEVIEDKTAASR